MAQEPDSIVYKNALPWRGCEKLYLDARTADVFFVFESDEEDSVRVPAHKNILSVNSEAFDAMFYGPIKQDGDIPIGDTTPEAFKEFLQFFYRGTVKLTAENAAEVWNLGKQYLVDDCCMTSSDFSKQTLTLDNMWWGYELAILFEQENLKKYCEEKISENPKDIFNSNSFLTCRQSFLRRILQLDSFKCDESILFDGCLAWAKAACIQKGLDETNTQNLRNQLGDLIYEIRFGDMTSENFFSRYQTSPDLFSMEEFRDIMGMIASKDYKPPKFNRNTRTNGQRFKELVCDRVDPYCLDHNLHEMKTGGGYCILTTTVFKSSHELILKSIHCVEFFLNRNEPNPNTDIVPTIIRIKQKTFKKKEGTKDIYSDQSIFQASRKNIIHLSRLIKIQPGVTYDIQFELRLELTYKSAYTLKTFQSKVQMDQGVEVEFYEYDHGHLYGKTNNNCGIVEKLIFMKPEENHSP